jgi:hypothetical protein
MHKQPDIIDQLGSLAHGYTQSHAISFATISLTKKSCMNERVILPNEDHFTKVHPYMRLSPLRRCPKLERFNRLVVVVAADHCQSPLFSAAHKKAYVMPTFEQLFTPTNSLPIFLLPCNWGLLCPIYGERNEAHDEPFFVYSDS